MKRKKVKSKIILFILSIAFVILFLGLLILSVIINTFKSSLYMPNEDIEKIVSFINSLSNFETLKDPFLIFIELLTSISGVFWGIRIGQWLNDKEEQEKLSELWKKIYYLLIKLKESSNNGDISIYELAEYQIFWDSLQRANNAATRILQEDNKYIDISFAFSFLNFYSHKWNKYNNINEWKANATSLEVNRIQEWFESIDELISYTKNKCL